MCTVNPHREPWLKGFKKHLITDISAAQDGSVCTIYILQQGSI